MYKYTALGIGIGANPSHNQCNFNNAGTNKLHCIIVVLCVPRVRNKGDGDYNLCVNYVKSLVTNKHNGAI